MPGLKGGTGLLSWDRFFRLVDQGLKGWQRLGWLPLRKRALEAAEAWMLERFAESQGLGAIFPPMIWSVIALRCLGYRDDSPEARYCHEHLEGLMIEEQDAIRLQPCKSPVWDTAITLRALTAAGLDARRRRPSGRSTGWSNARFAAAAIGPKPSMPNRAAGASNMPTLSIRTSTTR